METRVYRVPAPRSAVRPANNFSLFMALIGAIMLTACMLTAFAEDTPKKAPETVTLPADVTRSLTDAAKDAAMLEKDAKNLELQIELAKVQLEKLQKGAKDAKDANAAAFRAALVKAGIPASDVDLYGGELTEKGEMLLKRKAVAQPPSK